jgi:hypothetical protein
MSIDLVDKVRRLAHKPTINSKNGYPMKPLGTNALTRQPSARGQTPPTGYTVTTAHGHRLLVTRRDGRPIRIRPSAGVAKANRVESGRSYLDVPAA